MIHLSYIGGQNIALEQQSSLYLKIYYFYYEIFISYFAKIIMMLKFIYEEGSKSKIKKPELELIWRLMRTMVVNF